jgi:hypothetical protein
MLQAVIGWLFFAESLSLLWWIGASLIITGVLFIHKGSPPEEDHTDSANKEDNADGDTKVHNAEDSTEEADNAYSARKEDNTDGAKKHN